MKNDWTFEQKKNYNFEYQRKLSLILEHIKEPHPKEIKYLEAEAISQIQINQYPPKKWKLKTLVEIKAIGLARQFAKKLHANWKLKVSGRVKQLKQKNEYKRVLSSATYSRQQTPQEGFHMSQLLKAITSIFNVIAILNILFLSSMQYFFNDFRTQISPDNIGVQVIKWLCFFNALFRIFTGLTVIRSYDGVEEKYVRNICKAYMQSKYFYLDVTMVISGICLIILPSSSISAIFSVIVSLLGLLYLSKFQEIIETTFINNYHKKQYWGLIRLLLYNIIFGHIITLILFSMMNLSSVNWMSKYGIDELAWNEKYFYGYYWAISILATVGFGDISVANSSQAIIMAILMLFGCLFLSYTISQVGSILMNLREAEAQVRTELGILNRLAKASKIQDSLKNQMAQFIVHSAQFQRSFEFMERRKLIDKFPHQIKEEFLNQASKNIFDSLPFLKLLKNQTRVNFLQSFKFEIVAPHDYLTHKREGLQKIFILRQGNLGLAYKRKGSSLNGTILEARIVQSQFDPPYLLNKYLLKRGKKINYHILTQTYVIMLTLEYDDFQECLKKSNQDYEFYKQIYDSVDYDSNQWDQFSCKYCFNSKHSAFICPRIHYAPFRNLIFLKDQSNDPKQKRNSMFNERPRTKLMKTKSYTAWKVILKHYEVVLNIKDQKNYLKRMTLKRSISNDSVDKSENQLKFLEDLKGQKRIQPKILESIKLDIDVLHDFVGYFKSKNPSKINRMSLSTDNALNFIELERLNTA